MQNYEWVFKSTATRADAHFDIDVGDNATSLVLDDVFLGPTDLPPSVPGETPTTTTTPDLSNPGTPPPAGAGTAPPSSVPGQVIPNQGDIGSTPNGAPPSGGSMAPISGGMPPLPTGTVMGNGTCKVDADCAGTAGALCSQSLYLCYDPKTGYVRNTTVPEGWSQPPRYFDLDHDGQTDEDCGLGNVWWEVQRGCYDPVSGYAFDPNAKVWVWVGEDYVKGQLGDGNADDSSCSVTSVGLAGDNGEAGRWPWALGAALGAALTLGVRRRSRASR